MVERDAVRGVVLAGGDSTRFGDGDKALADLDGRPLLAHVLAAVEGATGGRPLLAVATPTEGERLRDGVREFAVETVTDAPDRDGPLAGLVAATRRVEAPWLLVCGCDMPLVTAEGLDVLRAAADEGANAVVPVVDGHDQPLHALYRRSAVERVLDDVSADAGPRAFLDRVGGVRRVSAGEADADLGAAVTNVNTREDLARLRTGE